jgi:Uma2 family endonuclease
MSTSLRWTVADLAALPDNDSRYEIIDWISDWRAETVEVYRRQQAELRLVQTLLRGDLFESPLLPGFGCVIDRFFAI